MSKKKTPTRKKHTTSVAMAQRKRTERNGRPRRYKGTLTNAKLKKMAKNSAPPQSWYDEDMEGLY
jgi:hypothetical protein